MKPFQKVTTQTVFEWPWNTTTGHIVIVAGSGGGGGGGAGINPTAGHPPEPWFGGHGGDGGHATYITFGETLHLARGGRGGDGGNAASIDPRTRTMTAGAVAFGCPFNTAPGGSGGGDPARGDLPGGNGGSGFAGETLIVELKDLTPLQTILVAPGKGGGGGGGGRGRLPGQPGHAGPDGYALFIPTYAAPPANLN